MIVVNLSHPLTAEQLAQLSALVGGPIGAVHDIRVQADHEVPFAEQAAALTRNVPFSPNEWQSLPFVVVPPGLSVLACAILSVVHGLCGHFPAVVRLKPKGGTPPRFDVAEVMNLAQVRDLARQLR